MRNWCVCLCEKWEPFWGVPRSLSVYAYANNSYKINCSAWSNWKYNNFNWILRERTKRAEWKCGSNVVWFFAQLKTKHTAAAAAANNTFLINKSIVLVYVCTKSDKKHKWRMVFMVNLIKSLFTEGYLPIVCNIVKPGILKRLIVSTPRRWKYEFPFYCTSIIAKYL